MIPEGKKITLLYKLHAEDGTEVANNHDDKKAQTFFLGRGQLMPALEAEIKQLSQGEKKIITLNCEQAFGEFKPEFVKHARLNKIPEKQRKVGNILDLEDAEGHVSSARIHQIDGNDVILDFNHPLAGQQVSFEIEIIAIDD